MNLQERLVNEIERVSVLRERYRGLLVMPGINVKLAIAMMTSSIEFAKKAASLSDPLTIMGAIRDLEGFTE